MIVALWVKLRRRPFVFAIAAGAWLVLDIFIGGTLLTLELRLIREVLP